MEFLLAPADKESKTMASALPVIFQSNKQGVRPIHIEHTARYNDGVPWGAMGCHAPAAMSLTDPLSAAAPAAAAVV